MKTIELIIAPDGSVKLTTKGYTGSSCRDGSKFVEEALGVKAAEQLTPEFHSPVKTQNQVRQ